MFVKLIVMRKNGNKNFRLASLSFSLILQSVWSSDLRSKLEVIQATSGVLFYIFPHKSFPYQKITVESAGKRGDTSRT